VPPRFVAGFLLQGVTKKSMRNSRAFQTSHNRTVYASPPVGGSASATARSIASLIPTSLLRHSLSALEMLRISLFGPPNRRKQPERYVQLGLKFCGKS
jgi:hypothetical protein